MQKYNIIGDIHGHAQELKKLLKSLGYLENENGFHHPMNHQALFVGDLINRGPDSPFSSRNSRKNGFKQTGKSGSR